MENNKMGDSTVQAEPNTESTPMKTILTMNNHGDIVRANYAVQEKGTDWEVKNVLEFDGRRYRTMRYCDTMAMARAEIAECSKDKGHEYRIVRIEDILNDNAVNLAA